VYAKVGFARFFYCLISENQGPGGQVSGARWRETGNRKFRAVCGEYPEETRQVVSRGTDRIINTIREFAEPVLAGLGLELVEIQFRPEAHGWVLRLFIDKEGGVTIDDCADVSREISAWLEVEDLIEHSYHLEVSSPGLERPLRRRQDFERFSGRRARIKLKEPVGEQRVFVGTLAGLEEEMVVLLVDGREHRFALNMISRARLSL